MGTKIWHFCHIMEEARIGANCSLGQNVFVDARAGTSQVLYEAAANAIVAVSSGQHTGPGPSGVVGGDDIDMISAVEMRIMGQASRAATGMSRKQANEIVLKCIEQYEPTLDNPPPGKQLQQLYDLDKLVVGDEWWSTYESVVAQLKKWGLPLR